MEHESWKIEWSEALSVGNPIIDAEHQYFLLLINDLNGAIAERRDKREIVRCMDLLREEAEAHFAHEEQLFAERGYPNAEIHSQHHAHISDLVRQTMQQFSTEEFSAAWLDSGRAIKDLMVSHILTVDAEYTEFLNRR